MIDDNDQSDKHKHKHKQHNGWLDGGVAVAQLVKENFTARPKWVKGEQAADVQVTTIPLLDDDSDDDW